MRGLTGRSDSGLVVGRVIETHAARKKGTTATDRLINQISDAFDKVSFDEREFAFLMSMVHVPIQRRFLRVIHLYVNALAERAEHALYTDDDEKLLCEDGKVMANAMSFLDG